MTHPTASPGLISDWLLRNAGSRGDQPALWTFRGEEFQSESWAELGREVARTAAGLQSLGVEPGVRVASVAENRREWILLDLALLLLGAVHVPVHATLGGSQIAQQIALSGAKLVLLSVLQQAAKICDSADTRPADCRYFVWDELPSAQAPYLKLEPWKEFLKQQPASLSLADFASQLQQRTGADLATIMFTSGTTGQPRGVMLSQGNLASNAAMTAEMYPVSTTERRLCFLPLSHIYARTCDLYAWIYRGSQMALARDRETIIADCGLLSPTTINGVPYFYDKIFRKLHEKNETVPPDTVQKLLGGEVKYCFCGGAALSAHVEKFFEEQGQPILLGYGLSETSPVISVSTPDRRRFGSVGRPLPGIEVHFAEDGEILTRGPQVMQGYWQDAQSTESVLAEGWLQTGDLGRLDEEGFLFITGRKKEILVTALGKNIEPTALELRLTASPFILQALVVGEGRNYLTALIVPNGPRLRAEIRQQRLWVFSRRGALRHRRVQELYRKEIDRQLSDLSRHEQIGRFLLLDQGFTIEHGELTPKGTLRREVLLKKYAQEIDGLYRDK